MNGVQKKKLKQHKQKTKRNKQRKQKQKNIKKDKGKSKKQTKKIKASMTLICTVNSQYIFVHTGFDSIIFGLHTFYENYFPYDG